MVDIETGRYARGGLVAVLEPQKRGYGYKGGHEQGGNRANRRFDNVAEGGSQIAAVDDNIADGGKEHRNTNKKSDIVIKYYRKGERYREKLNLSVAEQANRSRNDQRKHRHRVEPHHAPIIAHVV